MDKYPISIKWSDEDEGFIAVVPGIHGLSAFGESPQQALVELKAAARAYFQSLKKSGRPMPTFAKAVPFSGQLRLRLPKSLHAELSLAAENDGISLNTYLITLLAREHTKRELTNSRRGAGLNHAHAERAPRSS
jgi:predicted HicB family RNase H-like nuclease